MEAPAVEVCTRSMGNKPGTPWLNEHFLTEALRAVEDRNDEVVMVSWSREPASAPGTYFQSQLFRVVVAYRVANNDCTASLIVKAPLSDGDNQKEVKMYRDVFPEMFKLHTWRDVPKAYPSPLPDVIVMEDLREQGYRLCSKYNLLDFHHCKEVLLNLSTFHAISVRLHHECPELVESVGHETSFIYDSEESEEFWKRLLGEFASLDECAEFSCKIRRKIKTFFPSMVEAFKPSECLNVLTHNDLWLYNIMLGYDRSGELVGSKLVDFQAPRYCSFASDLIMFWWSSVDVKVRKHQEELFETYRQNLNKILGELDCVERVSKEQFDSEIRKFSAYALRPVAVHLPFALDRKYYQQLPVVLKQMDLFGVFS